MNDLRQAWRILWKNPAFTMVAALTLALGIGANTAVFSIVDQLLIRRLPVEAPEELAVLAIEFRDRTSYAFNYPLYRDYVEQATAFAALAAYQERPISLTVNGNAQRARGLVTTDNYFQMLGVQPAVGRFFEPGAAAKPSGPAGSEPVCVISHGLWRRLFGADPAALGKIVHLNSQPFEIAGVAPAEFSGTITPYDPEVYLPIGATPGVQLDHQLGRYYTWLNVLGRLKPGLTHAQAESQLRQISAEIAKIHPGTTAAEISVKDGSRGHNHQIDRAKLPLTLIQIIVVLLLLITCANVANLLLARASARSREIAIRIAMGASRWRIARQLLTESILLALLGCGAGLLVALWLTNLFATFGPPGAAAPIKTGIDWRIFAFAASTSLLAGLVFGLAPVRQTTRVDLLRDLKAAETAGMATDSTASGGARRWHLRSGLACAQISLSVVVLGAAGLCVRSAAKAQAIPAGFEPARVLAASMDLNAAGKKEAQSLEFYRQLLEGARQLPGVEAASLARTVALSGNASRITIRRVDGHEFTKTVNFDYNVITPDYFRTMGIQLLRGRDFDERDHASATRAVIINEVIARRYWASEDPLGKRIYVPRMVAANTGPNSSSLRSEGEDAYEIIGVARNSKYRSLTEEPTAMMFWPLSQHANQQLTLHLRSAGDPRLLAESLRRLARSLDPHLPLFNVRTLEQQRIGSLFLQRLTAQMLSGFGTLALLLAAIGVYGVLSYGVSRRTREIGIRMALGARVSDVLRLVLREGAILMAAGLAIGYAAALACAHLLRSFLHGISPLDPVTFGLLPILLGLVALAASWLPAQRAAQVQPSEALRYE